MNRDDMIELLLNNLWYMNRPRALTLEKYQELEQFIADQKARYETMTDEQLSGLVLINC